MQDDYADLKEAVEAAGFFTTFMPILEVGDRIVCASRSYTSGPRAGGLGGNSFWVAKRGSDWFIATWAPIIYRLQKTEVVAELCIHLLRRAPGAAYCAFDEHVRSTFDLIEIGENEFVD
jgi:hypothetical protein